VSAKANVLLVLSSVEIPAESGSDVPERDFEPEVRFAPAFETLE
jgi:hypothetical protein